MKYSVQYQQWSEHSGRPAETLSSADRDDISAAEFAALPQVGDHVNLLNFDGGPELTGVVTSRLFTLGKGFTGLTIVVHDHPETDWGQLIKE
ncbi:hypothetical protein [Salipiger sp. PrR003]|uniref:hypothetical protein n=1 Tax=Salipiger sp. PrR003 TaxID=2706776 RepID=UPI0013DA2120|nr:hypothetical protein [Salipiger sp. PrR003]NDV52122.1 hypothetical protein [Salipiger sp. PrR003]